MLLQGVRLQFNHFLMQSIGKGILPQEVMNKYWIPPMEIGNVSDGYVIVNILDYNKEYHHNIFDLNKADLNYSYTLASTTQRLKSWA